MSKSGKPYQNAVAEVVRALDPGADIQENEWIQGPDGQRECDIVVRGQSGGRSVTTLIECKDWIKNIPPEVVDAFHSKSQDLKADVAIICSNSNFSSTSLKKAERVEIVALSALQSGELRVRTHIYQSASLQDFEFSHLTATATTEKGTLLDLTQVRVCRNGQTINQWLAADLSNEVVLHPKDNHLIFFYKLKPDLAWEIGGMAAFLKDGRLEAFYRTRWLQGKIEIGAERSFYDHVTARLAVATGTQFTIEINDTKWKPEPNQNLVEDEVPIGVERLVLCRVSIPSVLIPSTDTHLEGFKIGDIVQTRRVNVGTEKPPNG